MTGSRVGDISGTVIKTGLQVIHLRTVKNEEITVPSSVIVNSHVVNYSALAKQEGLVLHTSVTIGYDTPWRQVHALLLQAAERTDGLKREPAPFVHLAECTLDDVLRLPMSSMPTPTNRKRHGALIKLGPSQKHYRDA